MKNIEISIDRIDLVHERLHQAEGLLTVLMVGQQEAARPPAEAMNCALWGIRELVLQAHQAIA